MHSHLKTGLADFGRKKKSHNVTGSWWSIKTEQFVGSTLPYI